MAGRGAQVRSVEAIESFRAALVVYVSKASRVLDEVGDEVRRTRLWIQQDQRTHWRGELRRRTRRLDQAKQELLAARLSSLRERTMRQEAAVRRAQEAVHEAEGKLRRLAEWSRQFDSRVGTLAKKVDSVEEIIRTDLPKAIAHLGELEKRLEEYAAAEAPGPGGGASGYGRSSGGDAGAAPSDDETAVDADGSIVEESDARSTEPSDEDEPDPEDPDSAFPDR